MRKTDMIKLENNKYFSYDMIGEFHSSGKWIHPHRMILTIHDPIPPKGKGIENIKETMAEAYAAVESALPEKHKGMVNNEDQDR